MKAQRLGSGRALSHVLLFIFTSPRELGHQLSPYGTDLGAYRGASTLAWKGSGLSFGQESQKAYVRWLRDGHLSRNPKEGDQCFQGRARGATFWANEQPLKKLLGKKSLAGCQKCRVEREGRNSPQATFKAY